MTRTAQRDREALSVFDNAGRGVAIAQLETLHEIRDLLQEGIKLKTEQMQGGRESAKIGTCPDCECPFGKEHHTFRSAIQQGERIRALKAELDKTARLLGTAWGEIGELKARTEKAEKALVAAQEVAQASIGRQALLEAELLKWKTATKGYFDDYKRLRAELARERRGGRESGEGTPSAGGRESEPTAAPGASAAANPAPSAKTYYCEECATHYPARIPKHSHKIK